MNNTICYRNSLIDISESRARTFSTIYVTERWKKICWSEHLCNTDDEHQSQTDGYQSKERVYMFSMLLFSWFLFVLLRLSCNLDWIDLQLPSSYGPPTSLSEWWDCKMGPPCLTVAPCLAVPPCFPAHCALQCHCALPTTGGLLERYEFFLIMHKSLL